MQNLHYAQRESPYQKYRMQIVCICLISSQKIVTEENCAVVQKKKNRLISKWHRCCDSGAINRTCRNKYFRRHPELNECSSSVNINRHNWVEWSVFTNDMFMRIKQVKRSLFSHLKIPMIIWILRMKNECAKKPVRFTGIHSILSATIRKCRLCVFFSLSTRSNVASARMSTTVIYSSCSVFYVFTHQRVIWAISVPKNVCEWIKISDSKTSADYGYFRTWYSECGIYRCK